MKWYFKDSSDLLFICFVMEQKFDLIKMQTLAQIKEKEANRKAQFSYFPFDGNQKNTEVVLWSSFLTFI